MILEFKQAAVHEKSTSPAALAKEALQQIKDMKYYTGQHGNTLLVGIGHKGKLCEITYELINN